jgi:hypothetical protein
MSPADEAKVPRSPRDNHIGRIPSEPPPGLPLHTPKRRPKSWRSRFRRWVARTRPEVWTFVTGNTDARRGRPWLHAVFIVLVLVALIVSGFLSLGDGSAP